MHDIRSSLLMGILLTGSIGAGFAETGTEPAGQKPTEPKFTAQQRRWWAIQPVPAVAPPEVDAAGKAWARNEIDAFIYAKLAAKGIQPSPATDRATFLRRLSLDLTGLPPTLEELQQYLSDTSTDADARQVDRLLASPRYGERWGRHWLDVVRYSDSDGFKQDDPRPNMWRYRDYVVKSLNDDKPFARFVQEQIAGDELFPGDAEARIGTGFLRLFEDEYNQAHIRNRRQELLNDITDNTAYAFLGVTLACARCHDHKFDPLLHRDYYRLQAFFSNARIDDAAMVDAPSRRQEYAQQLEKYEAAAQPVLARLREFLREPRVTVEKEQIGRFPEDIQAILLKAPEQRDVLEWQLYHKAVTQVKLSDDDIVKKLKPEQKAQYAALLAELKPYEHLKPAPLAVAQTMVDQGVAAPATHVLRGGAWDGNMEEVQPGFLSILDAKPAEIQARPDLNSSGRRTALAKWVADPANPLATRTIVNRMWHNHFGRGIVGSTNDFGVMGERPSNRELLDWLAATFTRTDGGSMKKFHRRILLSATYRQSSAFRPEAAAIDSEDKLLWRYPRRRLEAEAVRDSMLFVSGLLNPARGGPGVFPTLPEGAEVKGLKLWEKPQSEEDEYRASIYIFARRNLRFPMLQSFDAPDAHESCGRRQETVTPDQALELMNGRAVARYSQALAKRVANDSGLGKDDMAERAVRLSYGRSLKPGEGERITAFLTQQEKLAGSPQGALEDLCRSLLATSEFLYID